MSAAVVWSGGKDSMLALDRAVHDGHHVTTLFNIYDADSGRVRFHGVRRALIAEQAAALRVHIVQHATTMQTFERVFLDGLRALKQRGITDLIFGNIHLADVRAWYEERTTGLGFRHHEPLWDTPPAEVVREFVLRGYRAVITSVDVQRAPRLWLGRTMDEPLLAELAGCGCDPAGEAGEYHTFVFDGPLFREPVSVVPGEVMDAGTHMLLDLVPASPDSRQR